METQVVFEKCDGSRVTEGMLQEASQLFSEHYGVWSEHAAQMLGKFAKAGKLAFGSLAYPLRDTKVVTYDSVRKDSERITYPTTPHALTGKSP